MPDIPLAFAVAWLLLGLAALTAVLVRRRLRRTTPDHHTNVGEDHDEHPRIH